jgi:hypothetical protein
MKNSIFLTVTTIVLLLAASSARGQSDGQPSPWGIAASASSAKNYAEWFPVMSAAGVRSVRLFPEWRGVEPAVGKWTWERTDALVKTAVDNNLQITGLIFGSMPWSRNKSHAFPMDNLDAWSTYTGALVGRYKKQIHHWEIWNEGNGGFNDGHHTTADYATLVATAYDAAKKADPSAQVGMSVASFDAAYLDQAILAQAKAGKADHFDYLCIHPYELLGGLKEANGEIPYLWMSRLLRDALKVDAPQRANAEIWITEVGMPVGKNASERQAAIAAIKAYVMALAQGIARTMWFEARDPAGEEQGFGLLNRAGTPRAAYNSFKTMTGTLGSSPRYRGWLSLGKDAKAYGFVFDGASAPVLVAWMPAGGADNNTQSFTADMQVIDPLGNSTSTLKAGQPLAMTDAPLVIVGLPTDLLMQATNNASKNFPWRGDHSTAKTVSIQLGAEPINNGIMQVNRASTPPHRSPDGTGGVRIERNTNATFYLHPSFANLKTRDYYIRLSLRRLGPGNVGMNCSYEVADNKGQIGPMRNSGGWFSLPEREGWQTQTWHVTDACFAKMWGYDINFRPEKSVPFVIGKVEVSLEAFAD